MMVDATPDDNDMTGLQELLDMMVDNTVMPEEPQNVHNDDNLHNNAQEEISTEQAKTYCYSGPDLDTDDEEDDEEPLLQSDAKPAKLHELWRGEGLDF